MGIAVTSPQPVTTRGTRFCKWERSSAEDVEDIFDLEENVMKIYNRKILLVSTSSSSSSSSSF
jgi:hypothetical protein